MQSCAKGQYKSVPPHRRFAGYDQVRELRKAAGRGEKSCRLDNCYFIIRPELVQLITEGRANDGLDDARSNIAASYIQPRYLGAGERDFSYDIEARRQVTRAVMG